MFGFFLMTEGELIEGQIEKIVKLLEDIILDSF